MTALVHHSSKLLKEGMLPSIRRTAQELVACCFYFQQTWNEQEKAFLCKGRTLPSAHRPPLTRPGRIRCRFPNRTESTPTTEIRDLGTFLNKSGAKPCLLVSPDGPRDAGGMQLVAIGYSAMVASGTLTPELAIATRGGDVKAAVFLSFLGRKASDRFLHISGFPHAALRAGQGCGSAGRAARDGPPRARILGICKKKSQVAIQYRFIFRCNTYLASKPWGTCWSSGCFAPVLIFSRSLVRRLL